MERLMHATASRGLLSVANAEYRPSVRSTTGALSDLGLILYSAHLSGRKRYGALGLSRLHSAGIRAAGSSCKIAPSHHIYTHDSSCGRVPVMMLLVRRCLQCFAGPLIL